MSKLRIYNTELMNKLIDPDSSYLKSSKIRLEQKTLQSQLRLKTLIKKGLSVDWNHFGYSQPIYTSKSRPFTEAKSYLIPLKTNSINQNQMKRTINIEKKQKKKLNFFSQTEIPNKSEEIPALERFQIKDIEDSLTKTRERFDFRLRALNHTKYERIWKRHFKEKAK